MSDQWDRLNEFCSSVDSGRYEEHGLGAFFGAGKRVPYMGWWWREVNWETFGLSDGGEFIGFDEARKWDHPHYKPTPEQRTEIVARVKHAADIAEGEAEGDLERALRDLWDHIQTCSDTGLCNACWQRPRRGSGWYFCDPCHEERAALKAVTT